MKSQPTSSLIDTERTISERLSLAIPAAFVVALSVGLIASFIYLVLALAPLVEVKPTLARTAKVRARLVALMQYRHSAAMATPTQSTIEKTLWRVCVFLQAPVLGELHCSGLEVFRKLSTVGQVL